MKFSVSRRTLMIIAGIVWAVAGANILRIGINSWLSTTVPFLPILLGAIAVFSAFHFGVFSKMYRKHYHRISQKTDSNCPMNFLDARGWLIMVFMIALGVTIRHFSLMPLWFIASFYTGLSSALIITGLRFIIASMRKS
jgi:hypothetical protein